MPIRAKKLLAIQPVVAAAAKPKSKAKAKAKPKAKSKGKAKAKPKKSTAAAAPLSGPLGFGAVAPIAPLVFQEQTLWCWAACAEMVSVSDAIVPPVSPQPTQTAIVTNQLGSPQNVTQNAPQIVSLYENGRVGGVSIRCQTFPRPEAPGEAGHLDQAELDDVLQSRVPVQMGLFWNAGGGHVSVIVGTEDGLYVVHDPAKGRGKFTYDGLRSAYGDGVWANTFTAFTRI